MKKAVMLLTIALILSGCTGLPLTDTGKELVNNATVEATALQTLCAGNKEGSCKECLQVEYDTVSKIADDPNHTYTEWYIDEDYKELLQKYQIVMAALLTKGDDDPNAYSLGCTEGLEMLKKIQNANAGKAK